MLEEERKVAQAERRENRQLRDTVSNLTRTVNSLERTVGQLSGEFEIRSEQQPAHLKLNFVLGLTQAVLGKLDRMGEWQRMPPTPQDSRKRRRLEPTASTALRREEEPTASTDSTILRREEEPTASTSSHREEPTASTASQRPRSHDNATPSVPLCSYQDAMLQSSNSADVEERHNGTKLEDIVTWYSQSLVRGNEISNLVSIKPPQRFKDQAKFRHCVDLLDVSMTDEQRTALKSPLNASDLQDTAEAISEGAMARLSEMGVMCGIKAPKKAKPEYSGVGARVVKIKTESKKKFQTNCLKTLLSRASNPSHDDSSKQQAEAQGGADSSQASGSGNVMLDPGQRTFTECAGPLRPVGRHHRLGPNSGGSSGGSNGRGSSGGGSSGGGGSGGGATT